MSELTIVTNNVPREVINGWQLTADERAEFDYYDWDGDDAEGLEQSFFRYKGELHDLGEFMRWESGPDDHPFYQWDGYQSDSFFSGLLVRYCEDWEYVVVGRYCS